MIPISPQSVATTACSPTGPHDRSVSSSHLFEHLLQQIERLVRGNYFGSMKLKTWLGNPQSYSRATLEV
jgi:hypothetical protein